MDAVSKPDDSSEKAETVAGAGGVVFDPRGHVLVLGHRNGSWVFPKGHLDPGETGLEAALREVEEEAGVKATSLGTVQTTRYTNSRGEDRLITWFLMTTTATQVVLREATFPRGDFLPPAEARGLLSFAQDKTLLDAMLARHLTAHEEDR